MKKGSVLILGILLSGVLSVSAAKKIPFESMDLNKDGVVDVKEFSSIPNTTEKSDEKFQKSRKASFKRRDIDQDNFLCKEECELIMNGKKANIEAYRAKLTVQKPTGKKLAKKAAKDAEIEQKAQEALQKEMQKKLRAEGIIVCDTRVQTTKEIITGRLDEKLENNNLFIELRPGIYLEVVAADIVKVEAVTLDDECNQLARQKMGL